MIAKCKEVLHQKRNEKVQFTEVLHQLFNEKVQFTDTQMSISRLTLDSLAPYFCLPFILLRILTVHSRSHLLFEHRVDRNDNLNQTYTCMPCERKMQQTRRLNPTATVNMSNHVGFQHFPGEDCYSHQGQLLPAGC